MFVNLKDKNILVAAQGVFVFSFGIVLLVGHYAIKATTTSTVHTEPSIPTVVSSVLVSHVQSVCRDHMLFVIIVFKKCDIYNRQ